ncbi:hypothetical protein ACFQ9X_20660 [Catenulispora yoronensis]
MTTRPETPVSENPATPATPSAADAADSAAAPADSAVTPADDGQHGPFRALPPWLARSLAANETWTAGVLFLLVAYFSIAAPGKFLTVYDITQIATNAAIYLVLGVGMTFVVIVAGIDLSVGSVLVLSAVLAGSTPCTTAARPPAGAPSPSVP